MPVIQNYTQDKVLYILTLVRPRSDTHQNSTGRRKSAIAVLKKLTTSDSQHLHLIAGVWAKRLRASAHIFTLDMWWVCAEFSSTNSGIPVKTLGIIQQQLVSTKRFDSRGQTRSTEVSFWIEPYLKNLIVSLFSLNALLKESEMNCLSFLWLSKLYDSLCCPVR